MLKPFWQSLPISINDLDSRKEIIQDVAFRIKQGGHLALTGGFRMAKTSLLHYLIDPQNRDVLFGDNGKNIIFHLVDLQSMYTETSVDEFWKFIFLPLIEQNTGNVTFPNSSAINNFLRQALQENKKFVLILDEFDVLIEHSVLKNHNFLFGLLRNLASTIPGFVVILSSHFTLSELTRKVWNIIGSYGSPPLNIFIEYPLTSLTKADVETALGYAKPTFSELDRQYIFDVSGGHPFLVEIAASVLWQQIDTKSNRYLLASKEILRLAEPFFIDKWNKWDEATIKTITAIALLQSQIPETHHKVQIKKLVSDLKDFGPELSYLERTGEISAVSNINGGYKINQVVMHWWIADEILRAVRKKSSFDIWLLDRLEIETPSSQKAKDALEKVAEVIGRLLDKGATTLIEAYVKSLVQP